MKLRPIIIVMPMLFLYLCAPSVFSGSEPASFPICTDSAPQRSPAIDGDIVVWVDERNGNYDIYGYNLSTSTEFPICTDLSYQGSPAIDGDIVVWVDERNGNYDIYGYNLSTSTEFPICTDLSYQGSPAISGNIVVWQDNRSSYYDIYGYDLSTSTEFPICTASNNQLNPAISGNIVVWQDSRNGNADIYGYDLSTSTEFPISTHSDSQSYPAISGDIVVWQDDTYSTGSGNYDIYCYDLSTSTQFLRIYGENNDGQRYPAISGNFVVWQKDDQWLNHDDIYGYDLSTWTTYPICSLLSSEQQSPAVSGGVVVWQDERNGNWDIYGFDQATVDFSRIALSSDDCSPTYPQPFEIVANTPYYGSTYYTSGSDISACGFNDIYDVWNRYTPTQGGTVTISTDGSTFDTVLSVFEACGGAEIVCNDDYSLDNTQSQIIMNVVKGKTYYIRIAGFNAETGNYDLLVSQGLCSERPQSDANNDCKVNMLDLAIMASEWLDCGWSEPSSCL